MIRVDAHLYRVFVTSKMNTTSLTLRHFYVCSLPIRKGGACFGHNCQLCTTNIANFVKLNMHRMIVLHMIDEYALVQHVYDTL